MERSILEVSKTLFYKVAAFNFHVFEYFFVCSIVSDTLLIFVKTTSSYKLSYSAGPIYIAT